MDFTILVSPSADLFRWNSIVETTPRTPLSSLARFRYRSMSRRLTDTLIVTVPPIAPTETSAVVPARSGMQDTPPSAQGMVLAGQEIERFHDLVSRPSPSRTCCVCP